MVTFIVMFVAGFSLGFLLGFLVRKYALPNRTTNSIKATLQEAGIKPSSQFIEPVSNKEKFDAARNIGDLLNG